ncbi:unnamed protein product, partial [Brassica rapa subsp. trilocularis]
SFFPLCLERLWEMLRVFVCCLKNNNKEEDLVSSRKLSSSVV